MADLYGSADVTIRSDDGSQIVTITADVLSKQRLDVLALEYLHQKIHDSLSFFANRYATGLNNGTAYDVILVTSSARCHLRLDMTTLGGGNLEIREAATTSNNGTSVTAFNRQRASATVGTMTVFHTPTVTGTGTLLATILLVGAGGKTSGSFDEMDYEIILAANTKYLLRFNSTAGSNSYSLIVNWYEV